MHRFAVLALVFALVLAAGCGGDTPTTPTTPTIPDAFPVVDGDYRGVVTYQEPAGFPGSRFDVHRGLADRRSGDYPRGHRLPREQRAAR